MKIETGKFYKTRDGRKVRIYATDGVDGKIHGAIFRQNGWRAADWRIDGAYVSDEADPFDIIAEWHEPKLRPWRAEEVPLPCVLRDSRLPGTRWQALIVLPRGVATAGWAAGDSVKSVKFEDLLRYCEHSIDGGKTWLPCGVEE